MDAQDENQLSGSINRRQFLRLLAASAVSLFPSCQQNKAIDQPSSTLHRSVSVPSLPKAKVAIGRARAYDSLLLRDEMERMLGDIGGLKDLVRPGARVGLKPNLTGAPRGEGTGQPLDTELFVTHPAVVKALGEAFRDMGAAKLIIMDGIFDETSFEKWGYTSIAKPLGAQLVNLCKPDPYGDFQSFPVGPRACVYEQFYCNPLLNELDVLVSIGKMKCHAGTGVTLSLKNLIGIAPISRYRRKEHHTHRSEFHESVAFDARLSRIIIDLNRARPVHLAIIDGIMTAEGGAGPWDKGLSKIKPGVLIAGKDPVATDAVATTVMGFDPNAPTGTLPFIHSDNHLALAREGGLGTNLLGEIGIAGPKIQEVLYKFKPAS